jgi:hypothetical protein
MIKNIIDLLNQSDYYAVDENIDIAKGKYSLPVTWKDVWVNIKRRIWLIKK